MPLAHAAPVIFRIGMMGMRLARVAGLSASLKFCGTPAGAGSQGLS